ncbi:unnamed protein product, partial [Phaeothamnion confervicola]
TSYPRRWRPLLPSPDISSTYANGVNNRKELAMNKLVYLVLLCAALAGCNTVQGIGRDVEQGGEAIQRAVKK